VTKEEFNKRRVLLARGRPMNRAVKREIVKALHLVGCVAYWGNQDIIIRKYMKIESFLNVDVEKSIIWTKKIVNTGA